MNTKGDQKRNVVFLMYKKLKVSVLLKKMMSYTVKVRQTNRKQAIDFLKSYLNFCITIKKIDFNRR